MSSENVTNAWGDWRASVVAAEARGGGGGGGSDGRQLTHTNQETFPALPSSVFAARHYVADEIAEVEGPVVEAVALMVSELATNSIEHARTGFTIRVERCPNRVRVDVSDDGAGAPLVRSPHPNDITGRGLRVVESLADDWGVVARIEGPGKTVWFTITT